MDPAFSLNQQKSAAGRRPAEGATKNTALMLGLLMAAGVIGVLIYAQQYWSGGRAKVVGVLGGSLLVALGALAGGLLLGLLFAVPRALQERPQTPPGGGSTTPSQPAPGGAAPQPANTTVARRLFQTNANFERLSDWLTSIIVGLGLVNLNSLPGYLRNMGTYFAIGIGLPFEAGGAILAIILHFATCGFLFSYLITRLYLTQALEDAEQPPLDPAVSKLLEGRAEQVRDDQSLAPSAEEPKRQGDPVRSDDLDVALKVAAAAPSRNRDSIASALRALAQRYASTRTSMNPSPERTRAMEGVFAQMKALALVGSSLLPDFQKSDLPGERLVAVAFLETQPDIHYVEWLGDHLNSEKPFVGYHMAVALLKAVRTLCRPENVQQLESALHTALQALDRQRDTDRYKVLLQAQRELEQCKGQTQPIP
jgi:hypothetical protein